MTIVYRPNAKAVQRGKFDPRDRVVFYRGGRAMLYREVTLLDPLFNPAEAKKHFVKAKEQMPSQMNAFGKAVRKCTENNLPVPVAVFPFSQF